MCKKELEMFKGSNAVDNVQELKVKYFQSQTKIYQYQKDVAALKQQILQ